MYPSRGSGDSRQSKTVDMTSPTLCFDAPFCVTFDYIIPLSTAELQVLTWCGEEDWGQPVVVAYNSSTRRNWQSASIILNPCQQVDTKVDVYVRVSVLWRTCVCECASEFACT